MSSRATKGATCSSSCELRTPQGARRLPIRQGAHLGRHRPRLRGAFANAQLHLDPGSIGPALLDRSAPGVSSEPLASGAGLEATHAPYSAAVPSPCMAAL